MRQQQTTIEEAERRAMQALSRAAARVLELRRRREADRRRNPKRREAIHAS